MRSIEEKKKKIDEDNDDDDNEKINKTTRNANAKNILFFYL